MSIHNLIYNQCSSFKSLWKLLDNDIQRNFAIKDFIQRVIFIFEMYRKKLNIGIISKYS